MITPRGEQSVSELLAAIGQRLDTVYPGRTGDPAISDLRVLFELCQQYRLLVEQWEELCQMRCGGTIQIAEMVRAVGVQDG